MVVQLQLLTVDSIEMSPSLILSTESQRFLFNVGDGIQRFCTEHHLRLAKLSTVFLTELRPHTLGGLPGMILTISDTGKEGLSIIGPPRTKQYIHATRHFLYRPHFQLKSQDVLPSDMSVVYEDDEVSVHAIALTLPSRKSSIKRKIEQTNDESLISEHQGMDGESNECESCVSYVIQTSSSRGKFLVSKALELGVPKGKLFGELHQGKDVTLPNGSIVRSSDCVGPSTPGALCIILSCPSILYLPLLTSSNSLQEYLDSNPDSDFVAIVHLAPYDVYQHPSYRNWISQLQKSKHFMNHIVCSHPDSPKKSVYRASSLLQAQLSALYPNMFTTNSEMESHDVNFHQSSNIDKLIVGESLLSLTLAPQSKIGIDYTRSFKPIDIEEVEKNVQLIRNTLGIHIADSAVDQVSRVTFLGTGCAIPSKYRNVTGIHLQIYQSSSTSTTSASMKGMLLDCGEGSMGQLFRHSGGCRQKFQELVNSIQVVWISHNHADHHLGLLRLLQLRKIKNLNNSESDPVLIIGPTPLRYWLAEYITIDKSVEHTYNFIDNKIFDEKDAEYNSQETKQLRLDTIERLKMSVGITAFECVPVRHCHLSYALVFQLDYIHNTESPMRISFSGDCRPSEDFAKKAEGSWLMIHEATFEDDMADEAKSKNHTTISEAIAVCTTANARNLIMSHFSQRYPKMTTFVNEDQPKEGEKLNSNIVASLDLLSLPLKNLQAPTLMQACSIILGMATNGENE